MSYTLVYDLADVGFREWPVLGLAAGLALGGIALHAWQRRRKRRSQSARVFWVFAALMALVGGAMPWWDQLRLLGALREGRALVAEGLVLGHETREVRFWNGPSAITRYRWQTWEAFNVGPVPFGYYRDHSAVGFRNAEERRLALRDGMALKLHYVEDVEGDFSQRRILRVELRND